MNDDMIVINTGTDKISYEPYDLVPEDHALLSKKIPVFEFDKEHDPVIIKERLIQTLKNNKALGLAANQCGLEYNVFVMGAEDQYMSFFNPKIVFRSEETVHLPEYCLSYPFLELNISRPKDIEVEYQDEHGNIHRQYFTGLSARCAQHEIDHLNGITFIKVAKTLALKNGMKKRQKMIKQYARNLLRSVK